jgi:hypothetical protein
MCHQNEVLDYKDLTQTGISSSRVTVCGGNEAMTVFDSFSCKLKYLSYFGKKLPQLLEK